MQLMQMIKMTIFDNFYTNLLKLFKGNQLTNAMENDLIYQYPKVIMLSLIKLKIFIVNCKILNFKFLHLIRNLQMMNSTEDKQVKRTNKFNYLIAEERKQQLLGCYDKLNFSPQKFRKNYDEDKLKEKSQELMNRRTDLLLGKDKVNVVRDVSLGKQKSLIDRKRIQHQLVSFGKDRSKIVQRGDFIQQKQVQNQAPVRSLSKQAKQQQQNPRQRRVSIPYGNISNKRSTLANTQCLTIPKPIQFSPYQQSKLASTTTPNPLSRPYSPQKSSRKDNLLIYELQQQQSIIRNQLKQYQYQNQLLRQRIAMMESQNNLLKQEQIKLTEHVTEQELVFKRQIQTLRLDNKEFQEEINILLLEKEKLIAEVEVQRTQTISMEKEINQLVRTVDQLQRLLETKDQVIHQIKMELNQVYVDQRLMDQADRIENRGKRRKSLDLSTKARTFHIQRPNIQPYQSCQQCPYHTCCNPCQHHQPDEIPQQKRPIGKLLNKSLTSTFHQQPSYQPNQRQNLQQTNQFCFSKTTQLPYKYHSAQPSDQLTQKHLNFIQSIKTMYTKITNTQAKDLKQLWKWLKSIAHENQLIKPVYGMKDAILAVFDDLEAKSQNVTKAENNQNQELSFMENQCYKIIRKLAEIVTSGKNVN